MIFCADDLYPYLFSLFKPYEDKFDSSVFTRFIQEFKAYATNYEATTDVTITHVLRDYLRLEANSQMDDDDPYTIMLRELYQRVNASLIGARIRDARKAKGMSQTALAKRLNKTLRSVQKYETGEVEVSIAQLDIIADILEVSSKSLLGFDNDKIQVKTLEDVLYFIHDLSKKEELRFKIITKHPQWDGEWSASIYFDATDITGEHNQDICSMLNNYHNQLTLMPYVQNPGEAMDKWVSNEGLRYRGATLMNRDPAELYPRDFGDEQG